ncbi:PepSY domain-containing protein [Mesorhizobium sp.]|uniref:PepSY domain-containing protein n=1 Tax=Mesorhizobium sp. TaxID=1871066 RepID=UPI00257C21A6|nr:PepSY domain-containing protein [Mesorhizobium sp.]
MNSASRSHEEHHDIEHCPQPNGVGSGLAGKKCNMPVAEWRPREALQSKLEALGWWIRSIKARDGCYEAVASDEKGKSFHGYFNPKRSNLLLKASGENHG